MTYRNTTPGPFMEKDIFNVGKPDSLSGLTKTIDKPDPFEEAGMTWVYDHYTYTDSHQRLFVLQFSYRAGDPPGEMVITCADLVGWCATCNKKDAPEQLIEMMEQAP